MEVPRSGPGIRARAVVQYDRKGIFVSLKPRNPQKSRTSPGSEYELGNPQILKDSTTTLRMMATADAAAPPALPAFMVSRTQGH